MSPGAPEPLPPERFEALLRLGAADFGLAQSASGEGLSRFLSELSRWRRSMNLTGDLSPKALVEHTLESVLGERLIVHGARVIDIGSGAGFPGLPIAIVRGDLRLTLLEPRSKRSAFLRHVARELPLSNVEVLEARAADVGGQTYDVATVRAVGDPGDWALDTRILRPGGLFLAWTTSPQEIRRRLAPAFVLETSLRVPGSSSRVIASYRSL